MEIIYIICNLKWCKNIVTEKKINGLKMVFYLFTQIILESY